MLYVWRHIPFPRQAGTLTGLHVKSERAKQRRELLFKRLIRTSPSQTAVQCLLCNKLPTCAFLFLNTGSCYMLKVPWFFSNHSIVIALLYILKFSHFMVSMNLFLWTFYEPSSMNLLWTFFYEPYTLPQLFTVPSLHKQRPKIPCHVLILYLFYISKWVPRARFSLSIHCQNSSQWRCDHCVQETPLVVVVL